MQRRDFILLAAATALTGLPGIASAEALEYRPGLLQQRLDRGDTVFLDFTAPWCSTCRRQGDIIAKLKQDNPAYEANITFIDVDWDTYGKSQMATRMRIPRRSTLVVLKGDKELGRIVAETREDKIKSLLDTALDASSST